VDHIIVQPLFRDFLRHDPRVTIVSLLCFECSTAFELGERGGGPQTGRRVLWRNGTRKEPFLFEGARRPTL